METMYALSASPWISMWTNPRRTIREIVDRDPKRHVLVLAAVAGIGKALNDAAQESTGDGFSFLSVLLIVVVVGAIGGMFSLYISGALLKWTGNWLGGYGDLSEIRAAIAWSGITDIWMMALWIPRLVLFGDEMFRSETPRMDASLYLTTAFWTVTVIQIILKVWSMIVYCKCLGEVQGFSAWKALENTLLPVLVILGPILLIAGLAFFFFK